jgi:hypothetical protein
MADAYGKIGNNRLVKFAAKRESASGSYLSSQSTRDCRLRATERVVVRVKAPVGITGGSNTGSLSKKKTTTGNNKRGKAERIARMREYRKDYR